MYKVLYNDGCGNETHSFGAEKNFTEADLTSLDIDSRDILGTILLQGTDGRFYEMALDVKVVPVDPADIDLEVRQCSFCQKAVVGETNDTQWLREHLEKHSDQAYEMDDDDVLEFFPLMEEG